MEVLHSSCSAVSPICPLIILTPFCTQCYAVEHENKNTLPQVYQVSRHELVSGSPRKSLFFLLPPHQVFMLMCLTVFFFVGYTPAGQCKLCNFILQYYKSTHSHENGRSFNISQTTKIFSTQTKPTILSWPWQQQLQLEVHLLARSGTFDCITQSSLERVVSALNFTCFCHR